MTHEFQIAKKHELEVALLELFKKFTEETGLQVDSVFVSVVEISTYAEVAQGKRSFIYEMPEVTAKL